MNVREYIYHVVDKDDTPNNISKVYSAFMLIIIVLSLVPLAFRSTTWLMTVIEYVCVTVFIVDYILRWVTYDLKTGQGVSCLLRYPLTGMAIVDLLSIIPTFTAVNNAFLLFRLTRLIRIVRILKIARYSKELEVFLEVLYRQRSVLISVLMLAFIYILFTALLMFNVDDQFSDFFEALYWATTALTTVGYGDVCPHNDLGRFISMLSSLVGVAIIALPSGVITASYLKIIEEIKSKKEGKH